MTEVKIKLSGWQGIVAVIAVIALIIFRLSTFSDTSDNTDLIEELEFQLMTEYFPDDVENLKTLYESGYEEELEEAVESITTSELTILSVQTSSPLLSFKSKQKVIVKVVYSLDDSFGNRKKGTAYYRFDHRALGNTWRYRYRSGAISYYLNFI